MLEIERPRTGERRATPRSRAKDTARRAAQQRADDAREKLGELAFETVEAYFPEQAKARRRRDRLRLLGTGVVAGFLLRRLLSRRS